MKIRELLSDKSKWTRGCIARDKWGGRVPPASSKAVCWCLVGAAYKCYPEQPSTVKRRLNDEMRKRFGKRFSVYDWNDAPDRTFAEIKTLVDYLDI